LRLRQCRRMSYKQFVEKMNDFAYDDPLSRDRLPPSVQEAVRIRRGLKMENSPESFDWSKLPFKEIDLNQTKYNNLKALLAQVKSFDSDEILKKWKDRQIQQYTAEGFELRQKEFFKDMNQLKRARAKMQIPSWKKLPDRISGPAKNVNDWLTQNLDSYNFKSGFTFEVDELGPVGFYTTVDIIRLTDDGELEILDTAICMSQKLSIDYLYDDAFILAVQAKMLKIKSVKILRVNQETLDQYELEMDEEKINEKFEEFMLIYKDMVSAEKPVRRDGRNERQMSVIMMDFSKSEKIREVLDPNGKPVLVPKTDIKTSRVPSVTRILGDSKSPLQIQILERWRLKMIKQMGLEEFTKHQANVFREGSKTHELIEHFFTDPEKYKSAIEKADENVLNFWHSVEDLAKSGKISVDKIEYPIAHPRLPYCGIVDAIGHIEGFGWAVIDWKTSQNRKSTLSQCYDEPLQAAAYAAALGLNKGALVKIYKDREADLITIDPEQMDYYWNEFSKRYSRYAASYLSRDDS